LRGLPHLGAADGKVTPHLVQFSPEIEPLVRLLEDTPRDRVIEKVAEEVRKGTSYQKLLAAVFLAGVRDVQPRPVGYKFHAVLVINSAHLASLAATDKDRWLPLFWAVDNYKVSQAKNREEGDWHMAPVDEARLPSARVARTRFIEAMDNWDEEGTDRAVAVLARTAGSAEVMELFWRYGCRDFRDIGHKAIYAANSYRTLQTIGWRHAEPVLRSLAYAMLEHRDRGNPAHGNNEADIPYRENLQRLRWIDSLEGGDRKVSAEAAADLLACLRTSSASEGSLKVVELLKKGIHPSSIWDGLFLTAGELLMRQPGIFGIHCLTTANALHFAYQTSASDETRRLILLQAAAFFPLFRKLMARSDKMPEVRLDDLAKADLKGSAEQSIEDIFHDVSKNRTEAARKTLALVQQQPELVPALMAAARRLIFSKGSDSHDYKFSSAVLEDFYHLTPPYRARFAAASMFNLRGANDDDNGLIKRTRAALARA
jgi:hypothetical protein